MTDIELVERFNEYLSTCSEAEHYEIGSDGLVYYCEPDGEKLGKGITIDELKKEIDQTFSDWLGDYKFEELKELFMEHIETCPVLGDIMDLVPDKKLRDYMTDFFMTEFKHWEKLELMICHR